MPPDSHPLPSALANKAALQAQTGRLPTVWVLKCHRFGDHAQSLGLAQALGWPFVVKEMEFHWYELFFALPGYITLVGLYRRKCSPLTAPWPDLIIMAGRRNETPAKWIRRQSGGKTRIVVVGRYWTPPAELDLNITTHQFRLPAHPNVLHNEFPMHLTTKERLADAAKAWAPRLGGLPGPYVTLLVGGSSGPYVFNRRTARRLGREASALARSLGATLLVSTSARTGRGARKTLENAIDVPCRFYHWQPDDAENPYFGFLGLADTVIVTADSLSMVAEACVTERPVYLFEFGGGPAAMHGPRTAADPHIHKWWRWSQLKDQGVLGLPYAWWIGRPARRLNRSRDIRRVQDIYISSGRARWLGDTTSAPMRFIPLEDAKRAANRVRQMMGSDIGSPTSLNIVQPVDLPDDRSQGQHKQMEMTTETAHPPRIWLLLADKTGDNLQVQAVADALPWPSEIKRIEVREPFVIGKPKVVSSLDHLDLERSDRLEAPWPDLIITSGRRTSAAALWIQAQAQGRTKIVLIGLPKGSMARFSLAVVSEQYRRSGHPNLMRINYPLPRIDEAVLAAEADKWRDTFSQHNRPLIAVMLGGSTGTVLFDTDMARKLAKDLTALARREGGTLIVTTSRRTPEDVVATLARDLPPGTIFYRWTADGTNNPYKALLVLADRFIVTSDSLSMLMEVARLGRPLAIYLLQPASLTDRLRPFFGKIADSLGIRRHRDLTAIPRLLIKDGLAVWLGRPFRLDGRRPPDELAAVVARIVDIMDRR